jgi:beta-lactam-binding protein with PASTA domain
LNLEPILVPDLLGLTFAEANSILQENGISIGAILADPGITDTANAYIWKQNPPKLNEQNEPEFIQAGQIMDLWISSEKKVERDTTIQ